MENSDTDSQVFFWFQNQSHSPKFHSSCFSPSSHSAFNGPSLMSNTDTNTMEEEDVCESYMMRELTKKRKLSPLQLHLLEESFEEEKKLEPDRKLWLAKKLGLQPNQVAVWFQNRRARFKTKQLEHDWDYLKAGYAKLKTDRDILFVQNETLKNKIAALKEKLRIQENRSMEGTKLGGEGSDNTQNSEEEEEEEEEGMENQYSFPELQYSDFTRSNLDCFKS